MYRAVSDILTQISAYKRTEIADAKTKISESTLIDQAKESDPPRGFASSILHKRSTNDIALIAEIKRASPSKGVIRPDFDPAQLAQQYEQGGATCLSVLTDTPSFQGSLAHLTSARSSTSLPCLRKDFMLDPYQVYESRVAGADCILIIMAAVTDEEASALEETARSLSMDVLIETHNTSELDRALNLNSKLIGINNRDLQTFKTDLSITRDLSPSVPDERIIVSESGFSESQQLQEMNKHGIGTFLIGESLMRHADVCQATKNILELT